MQQRSELLADACRTEALPSVCEVRAQLAKIVNSPEFAVPERARSFLRYVVEEALAGRADRLKGYTIATAVFERDETFDGQHDPVVRIEAGRLRRALERYYLVAGQSDVVRIEIPKGGYVPIFTRRAQQAAESSAVEEPLASSETPAPAPPTRRRALTVSLAFLAAIIGILYLRTVQQPAMMVEAALPDSPILLVMPFASLTEGDEARLYAAGVTEEILTQLSRFKELTVLGRETTRSIPAPADWTSISRELAVRYVLVGSLRVAAAEVRVTSRLIDTGTSAVLWARTYAESLRAKDLFAIQEDIARQVTAAVAQPYGIIFRADLQKTANQPPDDLEAYACTLRFYLYRAELAPDLHALVRGCLERAVARFPGYATAWALLSLLELDESRFVFNPKIGERDPVERALWAARRAVELDSENARALQALMLALFFSQDVEEAVRIGELALAANPNDSELLSEFGLRIALTGQWPRGRELVERALARNPGYSDYYHAVLALIAYMQRDHNRAAAEIGQANLEKFSFYHAVAAIIYAELGRTAEARKEAARFTELHPRFLENVNAELARRNIRPDDRARLIAGLRKAGLPVPTATVAGAEPPDPS